MEIYRVSRDVRNHIRGNALQSHFVVYLYRILSRLLKRPETESLIVRTC